MNQLTLKYRYDASHFDRKLKRDDFGSLSFSVVTDCYSGRGHFWVQWQDIIRFGEMLAAFPIQEDAPILASWGFNDQEADDLIFQIEITPSDKLGNLVVRLEAADQYLPHDRVRASFRTNYPELETFRQQIIELMGGRIDEAVLTGSGMRDVN